MKIVETDRLEFAVVGLATDAAELRLGNTPVPLLPDGRADPTWVETSASEHLVGELELTLIHEDLSADHPRVVALPSRTTLEGFDYLANQLRHWAGPMGFSDPAGRARVWAHLSPRRPERDEEVALVLLGVIRRTLPALHRLTERPWTDPIQTVEWRPLDQTGGGRLDPYSIHAWDPPWPPGAPTSGQIAVETVELTSDIAENRFVKNMILALGTSAAYASGLDLDQETQDHLENLSRTLSRMALLDSWRILRSGPYPQRSFLIRDHPDYRAVAQAAVALRVVQSLDFSPLPRDPADVGIRTSTLNALYEVWVAQAVRAAVRRRVGVHDDPGAPLGRGAAEHLEYQGGNIIIRFDHSYPRTTESSQEDKISAWNRKQTPDVAVEWHPRGGEPQVVVVDATWSRNFRYHEDKLGYSVSLVHGPVDPLVQRPKFVCRHALVVYPGHRPEVVEYGWGLTRATVSSAPSAASWEHLGSVLDRAVEIIPEIK